MRRVMLFLATAAILLSAGVAHAYEQINPTPDPTDSRCPDEEWPFYYYRHPVLFQEITDVGTLKFVAFGYADACKQAGKGVRGGTMSTLVELPERYWQGGDQVLEAMQRLEPVPVPEALPGIEYPGDNVYRWDLPRFPVHGFAYERFYNQAVAATDPFLCPPSPNPAHGEDPGQPEFIYVCAGIHPDFAANILPGAGWKRIHYKGHYRWINTWMGDAIDAWFLSGNSTQPPNPSENFYARHWAEDMRANHSDGGVARVILSPVNLALKDVPPETPVSADGSAVIPAVIENRSSRRSLVTGIGWRRGTSGDWQPVAAWRPQGQTDWRPMDAAHAIPLTSHGETPIEVRIPGVAPGERIQLMVNYARRIPEAVLSGRRAQFRSAYADNIAETLLTGGALDLAITALEVPATLACTEGGTYAATWVITNSSQTPVTVRRKASVITGKMGSWSLGERTLTIQPGDNMESATIHLLRCDDVYTVRVEINPEPRAVEETDYGNNVAERSTVPDPGAANADLPTFQTGEGKTVIVPADCIPNPDPTSPQPCLNYPHLIISP